MESWGFWGPKASEGPRLGCELGSSDGEAASGAGARGPSEGRFAWRMGSWGSWGAGAVLAYG